MKAGTGNGSENRWIENDKYRPPVAVRGELIEQFARDADTVVVMSSRFVDRVLAEEAGRAGRCYIITSEQKALRDKEGRWASPLGNVLVRFASGFGANTVLIDPHSSNSRGLFLSSSLSPEAIRCDWRLDIDLKPPEISEMWQAVRWAFWKDASGELQDGNVVNCRPLVAINLPKPTRILRSDVRDHGIEAAAKSILRDGASRVVVATPILDAGHWMVRKLCKLADAGASVTVLTSTSCPASAISALKGAGIRVLGLSCLHANAVASERSVLLAPPVAAWRGPRLEFGLLLRDDRADYVRSIMRGWEENYQYEFR